jgi:hypothetical protein
MNQQNNNLTSADNAKHFEFADLPVADEQADEICGGDGTDIPPRPPGGGFFNNHIETLAEDETSAAALADLRVQADEQIKGGPNNVGTGVLTLNGANTYLGTTSIPSQGAGSGGSAGKVHVHDISIT